MFQNMNFIEVMVRIVLFYSTFIVAVLIANPLITVADISSTRKATKHKIVTAISSVVIIAIMTAGLFGAFWLASNQTVVDWVINLM